MERGGEGGQLRWESGFYSGVSLQQGMEDVASTSAMRGYLGGDMGRDVEWV